MMLGYWDIVPRILHPEVPLSAKCYGRKPFLDHYLPYTPYTYALSVRVDSTVTVENQSSINLYRTLLLSPTVYLVRGHGNEKRLGYGRKAFLDHSLPYPPPPPTVYLVRQGKVIKSVLD